MPVLQTTSPVSDPTSLLGAAYSLGPGGMWIGAQRTSNTGGAARNWAWVDRVVARNLNCNSGDLDCGLWAASEPK
jgi:hypothetical protein